MQENKIENFDFDKMLSWFVQKNFKLSKKFNSLQKKNNFYSITLNFKDKKLEEANFNYFKYCVFKFSEVNDTSKNLNIDKNDKDNDLYLKNKEDFENTVLLSDFSFYSNKYEKNEYANSQDFFQKDLDIKINNFISLEDFFEKISSLIKFLNKEKSDNLKTEKNKIKDKEDDKKDFLNSTLKDNHIVLENKKLLF